MDETRKNEEALEELESLRKCLYDAILFPRSWGVFDPAKRALEKRIPKKPVDECCPACKNYSLSDGVNKYQFCPSCGQALDWKGE